MRLRRRLTVELNEAIAHARKEAQKLKKKVEGYSDKPYDFNSTVKKNCLECAKEHDQLAEWLTELAERRETDRWIPVSERLPENECDVLITIQYGKERCVIKGYYSHTDKVWENVNRIPVGNKKVIAWKLLPEPYENEA